MNEDRRSMTAVTGTATAFSDDDDAGATICVVPCATRLSPSLCALTPGSPTHPWIRLSQVRSLCYANGDNTPTRAQVNGFAACCACCQAGNTVSRRRAGLVTAQLTTLVGSTLTPPFL